MSSSNYKAVITNLINDLRNILKEAHASENIAYPIDEALSIINRIEMTFDEYIRSSGGVDFTDRRFALALDLLKDFYVKTGNLKSQINQGKFLLALNRSLPEFEASLNTLMTALALISRGVALSTLSTLTPEAQKVPVSIPTTIQLTNPQAGQIYAYLSRVGQADTEALMRELGMSMEDVARAVNYLIANNYATSEFTPDKRVVVKLKKEVAV
ncbi:MAG: hypothetical protein ACP5IT_07860 [Thermoproteota archaeon]